MRIRYFSFVSKYVFIYVIIFILIFIKLFINYVFGFFCCDVCRKRICWFYKYKDFDLYGSFVVYINLCIFILFLIINIGNVLVDF